MNRKELHNKKDGIITIRINQDLKKSFKSMCKEKQSRISSELIKLINESINKK